MKRSMTLLKAMTPSVFFFWVLVGIHSPAQGQQAIEVKEHVSFWYVYMEFDDSHDLLPEKIGPLLQEIRKQGLQSKVRGDLFSIYFDSPVIAEGRRKTWGLGFQTDEETIVQPPLNKQHFRYDKVVKTVHQGPFETVMTSINVLISYLEENGLEVIGPPVEIWIGNPSLHKPEDLRTEIIFPVREKHHGVW